MESIDKYQLNKGDLMEIRSPLCSAAESLAWSLSFGELQAEINSLVMSYYNQIRFVIDAYHKLFGLFEQLNSASDQRDKHVFTDYDIKGLQLEEDFRNYAYLFIISQKTVLDSFTCLVDIIQNQVPRKQYYPDFNNYLRKEIAEINIPQIEKYFKKLRRPKSTSWVTILSRMRNNMIHGGYLLRPQIGFKKSKYLLMQPYKGTDTYQEKSIDIGWLFDEFMLRLKDMEKAIVNIFLHHSTIFPHGITHESTFTFGDLISQYTTKQIVELE